MIWRQVGVVIYPFKKTGDDRFLSLELGQSVVIKGQPLPGWYYGWKKFCPQKIGLFPVSHVATPKHESSDLLEKIGEICGEWGEIRKKLYVEGHLYQFEHIGRGIFELIEGRRALNNQSLTQDQYKELVRKLTSRIDWGNRKLGLDLIPWNWLLHDVESPEGDNSLKILPDCNKDAGRLFKLHQKSTDSAATRGSSTLSRLKSGKEQKTDSLYVCLRDFNYNFTDDCEVTFSLHDGKRFISERYTLFQHHTQLPQSNFHDISAERPTIFGQVNVPNKRELYLVVHIIRIGKMFYNDSATKKVNTKRRFRRPYACGVLSLNDIESLNEDELELCSAGHEKQVKLYNADEKDFHQVHELIVAQNHRNVVSKIIPVLNSFSVSIFWCGLSGFQQANHKQSISSNISVTRLLGGFNNNIIAPPGVVRNDLYLTISSVELLEKKQNKTGQSKSCNLEVEAQIIDDDDDLLTLEQGNSNCWKSIILHHINFPKYNETTKFTIPIETFPHSKLRLLFRHCSTKDKTDPKMFGIAWLNLMDTSGTTLKDGEHVLEIYKWTDENSLPLQSSSLPRSKDLVNLNTLMVSTKFTQNPDLVSLLKWKQNQNLTPSLQNLIASQEATEEIVRKFLQDVLDALFTIFSDDGGNSTNYSGDVFTLLVNVFQLLRNGNYAAYKTLLNAYCGQQFAAALVYKGLLLSLQHYTKVLLESVTEDVTQLIQNCYGSLEFIFKFVVQSQILFAQATLCTIEDGFRTDVKSLIISFSKVFAVTDCSPVFVETQSILLQNFHYVYEELLSARYRMKEGMWMSELDICDLVCKIFEAIPVKETAAHPLSPAKLSAIHKVVKSSLFRNSSCRAKLLPVFCKHIRHHLEHREELKLCTDVLSEILIYLHELRSNKQESAHHDIEVVCTTTLEMLVQSILVLERTSSIVGNLVTCLISLLEQMDHCHYNRLLDSFPEIKQTRDLLLRVFLLFRDLIKHDVFPRDWAFMKLLTNHVMLSSLKEFCDSLIKDFSGKSFDVQLWTKYFSLAVTFISQPGLQLESFREAKREWILEKYGDMRLSMGTQLLSLWTHLEDGEKRAFVPSLIGPFLEVTMIPQPELRQVTLQTFFYDMMRSEFNLNGNIKETESELIDRLDLLINSEEDRPHGDETYRIQFRQIHLTRLDEEETKSRSTNNNNWYTICSSSIESLSNLQQLLLDYRSIAKKASLEEHRDKLMQTTVNLLNFYKEEKRLDQYLRYVYKLHDLHLSTENYPEAGFSLLLYGSLLKWDREQMLPETYEPSVIQFPRQREADRKELLYLRVLGYFDQGKVWEKGIALCKELADQYEKRYDYTKLSRVLTTQAAFYDNILNVHRPEPEYFRVGFFGCGFPLFVRNKEFIYRGQEYERLGAFIQRITAEWPNATLLQKNSPPDPQITLSLEQYLQICSVKPKPGTMGKAVGKIPEKIRSFYLVNDVSSFQYDRRIENKDNGEPDDGTNEFKSMWVERTTLATGFELPGILKWSEIVEKNTVELSPVEFACEKMDEANGQLQTLISQYALDDSSSSELKNVNPLSMRLQGMLDAAVMGGIPKYAEAFFNEAFMRKEEYSNFVLKLISLLQEQVKLLEEGLEYHGKLVPPGVQPLHKRLLECHGQMKTSVTETELMVHSTLASLNNATIRRSDSGNVVVVRDSFRKLGSGKSIVNSPLPPVPKYSPLVKKEEKNNSSNRSSISSIGSGYGQVRHGPSVWKSTNCSRDLFDDEDDNVYSQPEDQVMLNNGSIMSSLNSTPPNNNYSKPPLIPSRAKKGLSLESSHSSSEYILMPPSRLREINQERLDGQINILDQSTSPTPPPLIPPKPNGSRPNSGSSPPPPLFPRKPANPTSITSSTTSLNSNCELPPAPSTPPPVPPKPKTNGTIEEDSSTYMNKAELIAELDNLNRNEGAKTPEGRASTPNRRSLSGHKDVGRKEYYVLPSAKDRNSTASN